MVDDPCDGFGTTPEEVSASVGRVASEVEILSRLEHPNIVNYHESFTHDNGQLYIIMELVEARVGRSSQARAALSTPPLYVAFTRLFFISLTDAV